MGIDKKSLEVFQVAVADWDDNNQSSENYEKDHEKLAEIYRILWEMSQGRVANHCCYCQLADWACPKHSDYEEITNA